MKTGGGWVGRISVVDVASILIVLLGVTEFRTGPCEMRLGRSNIIGSPETSC